MTTTAARVTQTVLGPSVLPPPPTRHALFAIVAGLAALVHLGTLSWGDLYSETEGQYAGAAREMLQSGSYVLPTNNGIPRLQKPPLLYWLIIVSYKCFGVSATAARLPVALAIVATTVLTFLLGERLCDYWRGFSAALIYLTLSGTFIFGRIIMPEPLFGAWIAGAIYCGVAGYQERNSRRRWFAGFWICAAFACLSKGPHGLLIPAATLGILAVFYREARLRFKGLLWWPYLVMFALILVPWHLWIDARLHGAFHRIVAEEWAKHLLGRYSNGDGFDDVPRGRFLLMHLAWWFPWSLALLPTLLWRGGRAMRWREMNMPDLLPMIWAGVVLLPVLLIGQRQDYYALTMFSAFALFAAMVWERTSRDLRVLTAGIVATVGLVVGILALVLPRLTATASQSWGNMDYRFTAWQALGSMPADTWLTFRPLLALTAVSLLLGAAITYYLVRTKQEKLAVIGLGLAMLPIGFSMAQGVAKVAPYFSLADAARYLNPRLGQTGQVLVEAPPGIASSLGFYLERQFALVNQSLDERLLLNAEQRNLYLGEPATLDRFAGAAPVFLIIEQERLAHWRELLTQRFHFYHQVATCGTYYILSNEL